MPNLGLMFDVDGPLASPITRTVAIPEILADLVALTAAGVPIAFITGRSDAFVRDQLLGPLHEAGLADALAAEATEHARRWAAQDELRDEVEALGRPTVELPLLPGPIDLGALFQLAGRLEQHLRTEVGRADRGGSPSARNERGAERPAGADPGTQ